MTGVTADTAPPIAAVAQDGLVAAFATEDAFNAWYSKALPRVYGYVFSRCGRDPDLAEEITQRTFVESIRARWTFEGRSDPVIWVLGIARHKLADHYRRLDGEERRNRRLADLSRAHAGPDGLPIEEREAIQHALDRLPAMQRAVLVFTALDGLSVREAADLLGLSESATESLLHRARVAFRRAYAEEGVGRHA